MSGDLGKKVHFKGPGQWRSQADKAQAAHRQTAEQLDGHPGGPSVHRSQRDPAVRGLDWDLAEYELTRFDPRERRDPHSGKWSRGTGTSMPAPDASNIAAHIATAHGQGSGFSHGFVGADQTPEQMLAAHEAMHLNPGHNHHHPAGPAGATPGASSPTATQAGLTGLSPSKGQDSIRAFAAAMNASALMDMLAQDWVEPDAGGWIPDLTPAEGVKALTSKGRVDGAGTPDDPIDVQGDIGKALTLMHDGKNVRLNQVDEVATLLGKVQEIADRTANETPKPTWDFGLLTVRGTNLFTAQNQGIARANMPQFGGLAQPDSPAAKLAGGEGKFVDLTEQLKAKLKAEGIRVTPASVPVSHLRATQTQIDGAKVAGFAGAVLNKNPKAVAALKEPIFVTRDNYVIDGHHRWASNMMLDALDGKLGNDTQQNVLKIDMDIGAAIPYANAFAQQMGIAGRSLGRAMLAAAMRDLGDDGG